MPVSISFMISQFEYQEAFPTEHKKYITGSSNFSPVFWFTGGICVTKRVSYLSCNSKLCRSASFSLTYQGSSFSFYKQGLQRILSLSSYLRKVFFRRVSLSQTSYDLWWIHYNCEIPMSLAYNRNKQVFSVEGVKFILQLFTLEKWL